MQTPSQKTLSNLMGECLHKSLHLYFYNIQTGSHQKEPFAPLYAHLDEFFRAMKKSGKLKGKRVYVDGWTQNQIENWVIGAVRRMVQFLEKEQISWFQEEWPLDMIYMDETGRHVVHLGQPDLVAFSQKRQAYLVLDFKTATSTENYLNRETRSGPTKRNKLLGYAYGARQKLMFRQKWDMKPITIGYVVFIREKIQKGRMPKMEVLTEEVLPGRLEEWKTAYMARLKT